MKQFLPILIWLSATITQAQTLGPSLASLSFPAVKSTLLTFSALTKGVVLLPYQGGVVLPGANSWYYPPHQGQSIQSVSPCLIDQSLFMTVGRKQQVQVIKLTKDKQGNEVFKTMATLPDGLYTVCSVSPDSYYIWGYGARQFGIWFQQKSQRDTLFTTTKGITAFAHVGAGTCFFAYDKTVWLLRAGEPIQKISQLDTLVDGLAVGTNGVLFVSSQRGIIRIQSKDKTDLITADVHGYLQWRDNALYVLDQPRNRVLQFQWQ